MQKDVKIGTVMIAAPRRFRNQSEFARWYDEIEVQPCTVDLLADVGADGKVIDWYGPRFRVSGPIVSSDWSPCWGGVPFADGRNKNLGKVADHVCSTYAHALAICILDGRPWSEGLQVTLLGFEARPIDFEYDGKPCRTFGIFRVSP